MLAKISILICLFFFNAISFIHAYEVSPGVLRTPDTQFENLKDYPFEPNGSVNTESNSLSFPRFSNNGSS